MYTVKDYRTKKALREDFMAGARIECFQPGPFPGTETGSCCIEGPHYPAPHSWYASAVLENRVIVRLEGKSRPAPANLAPTATCSESAARVLRSIGVDVDPRQVRK